MALFVVICGALMMLGGGWSLLMGFDIVMTERGAAMTIGGMVALAGGLVAIGIGGVLLRLSQILRALEQRQAKAKPAVPDRPVVPVKSAEEQVPVVVQPPSTSNSSLAPVAAGAGLVTAGIAGATALAREAPEAATLEPTSVIVDPVGAPDATATSVMEETLRRPDTILETLKAEVIAEPPKTEQQPDLEDELARALAEIDESPVKPAVEDVIDLPPLKSTRRKKAWTSRSKETDDVSAEAASAPDLPAAEMPVAVVPGSMLAQEVAPLDKPVVELRADDVAVSALVEAKAASATQPLAEALGPEAVQPESDRPKMLGTYNVGGRTYSMFADGSVEAMTEFGVERFASMDELRRHLART